MVSNSPKIDGFFDCFFSENLFTKLGKFCHHCNGNLKNNKNKGIFYIELTHNRQILTDLFFLKNCRGEKMRKFYFWIHKKGKMSNTPIWYVNIKKKPFHFYHYYNVIMIHIAGCHIPSYFLSVKQFNFGYFDFQEIKVSFKNYGYRNVSIRFLVSYLVFDLLYWAQNQPLKINVLKNFAIFTGKHFCWSLFLIKLQAWRLATILKRESDTGLFMWILRNF